MGRGWPADRLRSDWPLSPTLREESDRAAAGLDGAAVLSQPLFSPAPAAARPSASSLSLTRSSKPRGVSAMPGTLAAARSPNPVVLVNDC